MKGVTKIITFFFNDTATTEIYTLSLHDALPISALQVLWAAKQLHPTLFGDVDMSRETREFYARFFRCRLTDREVARSEEHTSELQSQSNLVCRLLLEKTNYKL